MIDPTKAEQLEAFITLAEPAIFAVEKYVVEILRLSRFEDRRLESAAYSDVGYLHEKRRDAIREIATLIEALRP